MKVERVRDSDRLTTVRHWCASRYQTSRRWVRRPPIYRYLLRVYAFGLFVLAAIAPGAAAPGGGGGGGGGGGIITDDVESFISELANEALPILLLVMFVALIGGIAWEAITPNATKTAERRQYWMGIVWKIMILAPVVIILVSVLGYFGIDVSPFSFTGGGG